MCVPLLHWMSDAGEEVKGRHLSNQGHNVIMSINLAGVRVKEGTGRLKTSRLFFRDNGATIYKLWRIIK